MNIQKISTKLRVVQGTRRYIIPLGYAFENNLVNFWSLDDTTIRFQAPLADITYEGAETFATIEELETYIAPLLGFNTATGGSVASVGMALLKTGQTTSYAKGDDGYLQAGRNGDFFTLAEKNPFGNTNRFTDTDGGQTYSDGVKLDWSTFNGVDVLGYEINLQSDLNWFNAIAYSNSLTLGGFSSWRAPNFREVENLYYHSDDSVNQYYKHMGWPTNVFFWTSNTTNNNIGLGVRIFAGERFIKDNAYNKLIESTMRNFSVRNFTLAELGL